MARLTVTANKLNKRKFIPVRIGDKEGIVGEVLKGFTFEGEEVQGVPLPTPEKWYKDRDGYYYWGGGVMVTRQPGNYPWWLENSLYSIPELWSLKSEQIVTVAILDTGLSKHTDFNFTNITGYNYLNNSADFQNDIKGHGTHLAGIIAAQGQKIYGIAPESHLFIAKVCDDKGRPVLKAIKNALDDIYLDKFGGDKIRIINMSFNLPAQNEEEFNMIKDIASLLIKISNEKQCILVCSSGSVNDIDDSFPARINECVAVGSLNKDLKRSAFSRKTAILDIMAPGEAILSVNNIDSVKEDTGTSQAAAFVTGVCSLALQKMRDTSINADLFKKILYQTTYSDSYILQEYGYGIINPNKLVKTILT
ncbi:MAG: S8 family serine peptidase [Bacteroidales bacterium]|jgi:subtilisin family serine protease|nr:S8 family serine peptidase [Bacteroidales bacterium]